MFKIEESLIKVIYKNVNINNDILFHASGVKHWNISCIENAK